MNKKKKKEEKKKQTMCDSRDCRGTGVFKTNNCTWPYRNAVHTIVKRKKKILIIEYFEGVFTLEPARRRDGYFQQWRNVNSLFSANSEEAFSIFNSKGPCRRPWSLVTTKNITYYTQR